MDKISAGLEADGILNGAGNKKWYTSTIAEFDETLVKRLIAKITVFENRFTVDFKSGFTIDIKA